MSKLLRAPPAENEYIAAIDLGSNSFHMIIARWEDHQLTLLDRLREPVRLGWGLESDGSLDHETCERALACLERFGERLRDFPSGNVRAVGTKTLRAIRDARNFLSAAKAKLGHPVEIISGEEEARLIYLGVAYFSAPDDRSRLVADIGGGSTEVILGDGMVPKVKESLSMGCVAMSKRFFADGKVSDQAIQKARIAAGQEVAPVADEYSEHTWDEVIGASGTIKAVASVCQKAGWSNGEITLESLDKIIALYAKHGNTDLALDGVSEDRQPVFLGGAIVLAALFENLNIHSMVATEWALREGLLFDLKGRLEDHDIRENSVHALAVRFHVNIAKAERVTEASHLLLKQVAEGWSLDVRKSSQLLRWASFLYPVGLEISHSDYHKHSAYIVQNVSIAGCSHIEQAQLAALVRAHRRTLHPKQLTDLDPDLIPLAIILRLAHIFHRTRRQSMPGGLILSGKRKKIQLAIPRSWLNANPLTYADLESEVRYQSDAGIKLQLLPLD